MSGKEASRRSSPTPSVLLAFTLAAAWSAVCDRPTSGDEVYRKSSAKPVRGTVTAVSRQSVTVTPKVGSAQTIPANDIDELRWDGEPAKLVLARSAEKAGRLEQALEGYREALKSLSGSNERVRQELEFLAARAAARLALRDGRNLTQALQQLEAFVRSAGDSYRYYPALQWLGRVALRAGDLEKAKWAFEQLQLAPWPSVRMAAKASLAAQVLVPQKRFAQAEKLLDEVLAVTPSTDSERLQRWHALLGKAVCLLQQQKAAEALKLVQQVIEEAPAEQTALYAEAYLRQGDCLQQMGRLKEAVLAYLHVPVLFPNENEQNAEALYQLAKLWPAVGWPDRGAQARAELESKYPNSPWTRRLLQERTP